MVEESAASGRRLHWKRWTLIGAVAIVVVIALYRYRSLMVGSFADFGHLKWGSVATGAACECVSMTSFARMQRHILRSGGLLLTVESMVAITYAGNAIAVTLPLAGSGLGAMFLHRQYTARGASGSVATWVLAVSGIFSAVAFGLITSGAALASGDLTAELGGIAGVVLVLLPLTGVWLAVRYPLARAKLAGAAAWAVRQAVRIAPRRVASRIGRRPEATVSDAMARIAALRLTGIDLVAAAMFAVANWVFDIACLGWAIKSVGMAVPWGALILIWAAGAGAASFSLTPGGLGVIEPALAAALVAGGLPAVPAMSAVLIYRFISFWLVLAFGWLAYAVIKRRPSPAADRTTVLLVAALVPAAAGGLHFGPVPLCPRGECR
jgi:putative heme transporter